jgi:hypothetical protein
MAESQRLKRGDHAAIATSFGYSILGRIEPEHRDGTVTVRYLQLLDRSGMRLGYCYRMERSRLVNKEN